MSEYLPLFKPGDAVTYTATSAVTGGRLVEITGDRQVAHAAASSTKVVGVASVDAPAGGTVTVYSGGVQLVEATGSIAAGDAVDAAADGKVVVATGAGIGVALSAATAGALAQVKLK